jgi:tripartite-type tricarboxylate transporter receptor subunit TctC
MLTRRAALAALAGTSVGALIAPPYAQSFPSRTVTIIVPYPPGGPVDVLARLIAQHAQPELGQAIVVENRAGGSGVIGSVAVMRAEPDGHTLVLGTNQTHATNQSLLKNCPYDAEKDFAPVANLTEVPHALVVKKDLGVASAAELVAMARQKPGALTCGSTGVGSASHLTAELFKTRAGVDVLHVPFRGAAPLVTELVAGRIDTSFATLPSVISQIKAGEIKALAIASPKRAEALPDVPTLQEAGIAGIEADAWFALFAPAKTPDAAVQRLYQAISAALSREQPKSVIAAQGMTLALKPPAALAALLPGEIAKWGAVIKSANISVE